MMPRSVIKEVGYLDVQFFYHVDADYCKRITDAGYKCYYLPTAEIVHLNHKGGTMTTLLERFRLLTMFEIGSYRYYRKHIQTSWWSPMQIFVVLGLSFHFLALASGAGFRRAPRYCARRISRQKAGGSLIASREPSALEKSRNNPTLHSVGLSDSSRSTRPTMITRSRLIPSLSHGESGKGALPGCCFCPTRFL